MKDSKIIKLKYSDAKLNVDIRIVDLVSHTVDWLLFAEVKKRRLLLKKQFLSTAIFSGFPGRITHSSIRNTKTVNMIFIQPKWTS